MGRAKVILKPIEKGNARRLTFSQRKKGLLKKVSDFHKFSGDEACLIVYDADGNGEPAIWPQEPSRVHSILGKYEHEKSIKDETFDLENFFDYRKMMVEAEIARVKKEIFKVKYPTWDPCFNDLTMEQLSFFMAKLTAKIEACDHRIDLLKKERQSEDAAAGSIQNMAQESAESSNPSQLNSMLNNIPEGQLMKPLNDNNGIDMLKKEHLSEAAAATLDSIQNLAQDSAESSNPSQLNSIFNGIDLLKKDHVREAAAATLGSIQNLAQDSAEFSNPSQLNSMLNNSPQGQLMKPLNDNNGMVDSTVEVNVPLDSTNQLENVNWDDLGPLSWCKDSTNCQSDLMIWASQLEDPIVQNILQHMTC